MGQLTNYTEKKVLDHLLLTAEFVPEAVVYLGLSTADPTHDGSGWTDPTYTGYGRKAITFAEAGSRAIAQTGAVTFTQCSAGSSLIPYWGLWDAETDGNLLAYGTLLVQKNIVTGNTPSVASGQVTVSFSAGVVFTGLANSILDWLFRDQVLAQPTHVKIGLSTSTPADDGTNITEPGNNYAKVNHDGWNGAAGDPEAATNHLVITMPVPSGTWGLITHGVVYLDAIKAFYGTVPNQTPDNGDTVEWLDTQFSISIQ